MGIFDIFFKRCINKNYANEKQEYVFNSTKIGTCMYDFALLKIKLMWNISSNSIQIISRSPRIGWNEQAIGFFSLFHESDAGRMQIIWNRGAQVLFLLTCVLTKLVHDSLLFNSYVLLIETFARVNRYQLTLVLAAVWLLSLFLFNDE